MEERIITFTANEQGLVKTGGISHYASDTISYIKAVFTLGENWQGFDEVRAVFKSPYECRPAVLDSNGECYVPVEVLFYKGKVKVNLVGSIVTETEVTDRLTTYSVEALDVDEDVPICGEESQPISPSEYEQFVAKVANDANRAEQSATDAKTYADEAEASAQNASESASASAVSASDSARSATASAGYAQNAKNSATDAETAKEGAESARDKILDMRATAETLEAGSDATASYSDGLLTLGIPRGDQGIQGIQGDTGATPNLTIGTVETLAPTEDATATITGTAENPVLNLGIPKGDTGEVSQAELDEAITDLKSDISDIVADEHSINLFDLGSPDIEENAWVYPTTGVITEKNWRSVTPLIEVEVGKTYCYKVSSIYWTDEQRKTVWFYDESGNPISSITGTLSDGINTFTVPSGVGKYVRVTYDQSEASWMFIEGDEYPSDYVPYWSYTRLNPTIAIEQLPNEKSSVQNLYDKNAIDKSLNHYVSTTGSLVSESRFDVSGFIPVEYGKTYAFPVYPAFFGDSVAKQAIGFNKDKTFRATLHGVIADNVLTVEITNQFIAFIRVNIANGSVRSDIKSIYQNPDVFMVTEAPYPTNGYAEYGNIEKLKNNISVNDKERNDFNPLYGKTVVFAGDSICNGSSANDGKYGYAGRIGNKNHMMWLNAGISGGTFTANLTGSAGVISETNFFNSDYLIIEGGTNDADLIGNALSTHPAKFGTYDMSDFTSNYDSDTFCGAIEALFKRIVSDYKGKKIGVIIAQKMTRLNVAVPDYTKEHNNRRYYFETLMALCEKWGIPYLNLWDGCHLNPMIPSHYTDGESYMYTDGQHLAPSGYDYIASIIEDWMKTL